MGRISVILLLMSVTMTGGLLVHFADDVESVHYVGQSACATCHMTAASGQVQQQWASGPHSSAFSSLSSERALTYIDTSGREMVSCLSCHATLGRPPASEFEERINAEGVGCERCHGPGSRYQQSIVMRDASEMKRVGGEPGNLDDCYSCHSGPEQAHPHPCPFELQPIRADSAWAAVGHTTTLDSAGTIQFGGEVSGD